MAGSVWIRSLAAVAGGAVVLLSGCGDFFTKDTSGGGGGAAGNYAYVGTQTGALASFSVSSTGGLTAVSGSPQQLATSAINALAVTPGNAFVYAAVAGAGVFGLSINSGSGAAALIKTSPLAADVAPLALTIDPTGKFLLVAGLANGGAAVGVYAINSDGTLAELSGSPIALTFPSGTDLTNLSVQQIAVAPNSNFVFVSLGQLGVAPLPFTTSGVLSANTQIIPARTTASGGATVSNQDLGLAVDPASKFLFIGETNAGVRVLNLATSGFPEVTGSPFTAGSQPRVITMDGTGANVYAANAGDSTISGYSLQATTGALTPLTGSPFSSVGRQPYALALDQSKKFLLAANLAGSPDVQLFSFDATTAGKLDPGATITNVGQPSAVASTH